MTDSNGTEQNGNLSAYQGRWIAEIQGRIVGQGGTREQALQSAKAARRKETPQVRFIPSSGPLAFHSYLEKVTAAVPESVELFLVGGAVRDALLGKPSYDLDFCLEADAQKLARKIANKLNGAYYRLDDKHGGGRVVISDPDLGRVILDFAPFNGDSIEDDLKNRDFTINAAAVNVRAPYEVLDPLGGAADLAAGRIRACSPQSLSDDPVRVLRAVRFASRLQFQIQPETLKLIRQAVPGLVNVSVERQRDEFFKILAAPKPAVSLRVLQTLGILEHLLPQTQPMKGFLQKAPHIYDVWEHSLHTLSALDDLMMVLDEVYHEEAASQMNLGLVVLHLGRYREQITAELKKTFVQERPVELLLRLAAIYHDVGKPISFQDSGDYHSMFPGHDISGAAVTRQMAERMHFSRKEITFLESLVRNHLTVTSLTKTDGPLSRKQLYHFFRDVGDYAVPVILLNIADIFGCYGPTLTQAKLIRYLEVSRQLLDALWHNPGEDFNPRTLLSGQDLMELFELEPGPQIGQLLEALREAQVVEGIDNRPAAVAYLRSLVEA